MSKFAIFAKYSARAVLISVNWLCGWRNFSNFAMRIATHECNSFLLMNLGASRQIKERKTPMLCLFRQNNIARAVFYFFITVFLGPISGNEKTVRFVMSLPNIKYQCFHE